MSGIWRSLCAFDELSSATGAFLRLFVKLIHRQPFADYLEEPDAIKCVLY